jgi:hypothetical protein
MKTPTPRQHRTTNQAMWTHAQLLAGGREARAKAKNHPGTQNRKDAARAAADIKAELEYRGKRATTSHAALLAFYGHANARKIAGRIFLA